MGHNSEKVIVDFADNPNNNPAQPWILNGIHIKLSSTDQNLFSKYIGLLLDLHASFVSLDFLIYCTAENSSSPCNATVSGSIVQETDIKTERKGMKGT